MKRLILFAGGFFIFGVGAQDQQSDEIEQNSQSEEQVLGTDFTPEELVAVDDHESVSESNVEEGEEEQSDSRFIPTEQISQDLGVSFPVDI